MKKLVIFFIICFLTINFTLSQVHRLFDVKNVIIQDTSYIKKDSSTFMFLNNNQFIFEIDSSICLFYNTDHSFLIIFQVILNNNNEVKIARTNLNFNLLGYDFSDSHVSHEYLIRFNYQNGFFYLLYKRNKDVSFQALLSGSISIISYEKKDFLIKSFPARSEIKK